MHLQERLRQREKKAKLAARSKLSFGEEGNEQDEEEEEAEVGPLVAIALLLETDKSFGCNVLPLMECCSSICSSLTLPGHMD